MAAAHVKGVYAGEGGWGSMEDMVIIRNSTGEEEGYHEETNYPEGLMERKSIDNNGWDGSR